MSVNNIANGDNTTGHVATASTLGISLAVILVWLLSQFHITVDNDVTGAFGVLFSVISSCLMQRFSN